MGSDGCGLHVLELGKCPVLPQPPAAMTSGSGEIVPPLPLLLSHLSGRAKLLPSKEVEFTLCVNPPSFDGPMDLMMPSNWRNPEATVVVHLLNFKAHR